MAMEIQNGAKQSTFEFIVNFAAGGVSAAWAKWFIAPIERVKLILQNQDVSTQLTESTKYKGTTDWIVRIYNEQGILSFWRGNLPNCFRYLPAVAFSFAFKSFFSKYFKEYDGKTEKLKFFFNKMIVGGLAGTASLTILYPLDFARTRMGVDTGKNKADRQFTGIFDLFKKVYNHNGITGVYKGFGVSVYYAFIKRAAYFGLYDTGKALFFSKKSKDEKRTNFFTLWMFAQLTTVFSNYIAYPFDTVRRRLMMQSAREDVLYKNSFDCTYKIYKKEGAAAFFKGHWANTIRWFGASLVLVLYDEIQEFLKERN